MRFRDTSILAFSGKRQATTTKALIQAQMGAYLLPFIFTTSLLVKDVLVNVDFWFSSLIIVRLMPSWDVGVYV